MKDFLSKNKWPLLLAAFAILIRIIYLIEISGKPGFSILLVDEQWHWQWAQEIVEKSFWGNGSYFRGPLYPYFLAFLYLITGGSILASKIIQVLVCGGTVCFIYKLAEHLFNSKAAIVSGLVYALYGTLIFYETMFLIPVLFLFFTVWSIYRLIVYQNSELAKTWIITGLIFGLAALARPNILLVIPFLALWLFLKHKKTKETFKSSLRPALLWITGILLAIVPVTIRNIAVTGEFALISSQGGINLYLGNNEYADGLTMMMPELELDQSVSWDMFVPMTNSIAEQETGHSLTDSEISGYWSGKAFDFILSNPGKFLNLLWRKTVFLFSGFENSDATDIYYQRNKSTLYALLLWDNLISFPYGLLIPLFIVSLIVVRHKFRKLLPVYIFMLAYIPTIILFLVTARHRLVLIPFLIIIVSAGITTLFKNLRKYNPKILAAILPLFVVSLVILNQKFYGLGEPNPFYIHYNNGLTFQKLEEYKKAEKEYQLADRVFPFSAALAVNLADVQLKLGKLDMADQNLNRAIALKPMLAMSYHNLGLVVREKGELDSAVVLIKKAIERFNPNATRPNEIGEYYLNLAGTYQMLGKLDSAEIAFNKSMEESPLFPKAVYQAALFYSGQKRFDISDSLYVRAMHLKRPDAVEEYNWGMTYMEREQYTYGLNKMFRAIKKDPKFYRAWYVIAALYRKNGEPKDSVNFYLNECLSIQADYQPAVELKKIVNN